MGVRNGTLQRQAEQLFASGNRNNRVFVGLYAVFWRKQRMYGSVARGDGKPDQMQRHLC